jgi:hypothetical protein
LRFARTRLNAEGKAVVVPGQKREVAAKLVVSSIGSIPEPIEGLPMDGELLRLEDHAHGKVMTYENVYGAGNVVTGKGNLVASRRHAAHVAKHLATLLDDFARGPSVGDADLLARVRQRQAQVGYDGSYASWIARAATDRAA